MEIAWIIQILILRPGKSWKNILVLERSENVKEIQYWNFADISEQLV